LYTFTVTGINRIGESMMSLPMSARPARVPNAPVLLSGSNDGNARSSVSWSFSDFNGGEAITGYKITATPKLPSIPTPTNVYISTVTDLTSTFLSLPVPAVVSLPDPSYSFSFWIKVDTSYSNWRNVMLMGRNDGDRTPALYIVPSSNRLWFRHYSTRSADDGIQTVDGLTFGDWTHITTTIDVNIQRLYINGILDTEVILPTGHKFTWNTWSSTEKKLNIAWTGYDKYGGMFFNSFYFYNYSLSALDVAALSNSKAFNAQLTVSQSVNNTNITGY